MPLPPDWDSKTKDLIIKITSIILLLLAALGLIWQEGSHLFRH